MHIEMVQSLRCPAEHESSWLVARTDRLEARHIVAGVLGCPICGREYPIVEGILKLGTPIEREGVDLGPEAAVRAAALLGLTSPGGVVLLAGAWSSVAVEVASMADGVHVLAMDAQGSAPPAGLGVSRIDAGATMPLGEGVARGIALDQAHADPNILELAARALRSRGRLLAPARADVPHVLEELARDDAWWVAERPAVEKIVPLASRSR
jgi:uncharacterized protein YbaR (Trm112 family)